MLKSSAFWSTVIAVVALILSQLPPVRELLKPRQLRIVVPEILTLQHYLGNLQLVASLGIHNTGGRNVTVQRMECILTGEEKHWRLPAQTYMSRQTQVLSGQAPVELIMSWIALKPGEHWTEQIRFFKVWSVQEEEKATSIIARIKEDIHAKIAQRKPEDGNKLMEADEKPVREAREFFDKKFNLTKGSYKLLIAAIAEKNEVVCVLGFDFTLFDHQIHALCSAVDDYKIGAGIYFPNADVSKGTAMIRLRQIEVKQAQGDYARLAGQF